MDPKNNYSLLYSVVNKLVEKNVAFTFKNKTINFDCRENISIDSIAPFGDKIIITTPEKELLVMDSITDLTSFHPFCSFYTL